MKHKSYQIFELVPNGALCDSVPVGFSHGRNRKEALENYRKKGGYGTKAEEVIFKGFRNVVSPLEKKVSA